MERRRQPERAALDGDLPLLHRLQQSRLRLGWRPVDLVGQQQAGEQRPRPEHELRLPHVVDERAGHVGGQQVRGELQSAEAEPERLGERPRCQRLAQAGEVLHQDVPAGQDRREHQRQRLSLADHRAFHPVEHRLADHPDLGQGQREDGVR